MIITLAGLKGSGKSATGKKLAEILDYSYVYMGQRFREEAISRGMTIKEFDEYVAAHPEIDKEMDQKLYQELGDTDNIIIDANIGAFFRPNAYKVFFTAPLLIRAQRVAKNPRSSEKQMTVEQAAQNLSLREQNVDDRLYALYGFRVMDESNYDLVVDTSDMSIKEVADYIIAQAQQRGFQL